MAETAAHKAYHEQRDVASAEKYGGTTDGGSSEDEFGFNSSATAMIKNPLAHLSEEEVARDVAEFAKSNDFEDLTPILTRGALIAKDPPNFESVPGVTEDELTAIRNEVLHKWKQPVALYYTIILCPVGAAVQGWDQTGSSGANLSFPDALGIPISEKLKNGQINPDAARNQWLQGLVNAGPYIA